MLPSPIRSRYALVRRACVAFFESKGRMPTEIDLAEELPVSREEIRDALQFHDCRRTRSLDEAYHETGRTLHDNVAATFPLPQPTDGLISRLLATDRAAAEEVEVHLADPLWLEVVATRAGMSISEVELRLRTALAHGEDAVDQRDHQSP